MSGKVINVGFIGNPNCGKTTLFNAYTGANLKVANWPGVTVEKKEGRTTYKGQEFKLIDLPGIYSLTSYTMEEKVSRECIMSDEVDVIVDVVDASCLERNLYLTLQLIELGKPVVLALDAGHPGDPGVGAQTQRPGDPHACSRPSQGICEAGTVYPSSCGEDGA